MISTGYVGQHSSHFKVDLYNDKVLSTVFYITCIFAHKLFSLRGRTFYNVRVEVFAAEILMIADTCSLFRLVQHDWTCFGSYTKWDRRSVSLFVDRFVNRLTCFKIQTF